MYRGKAKNEDQASDELLKESGSESVWSSSKIVSAFVQLATLAVAVLIIFRTISDAGVVLYTFHPSLMAVGYLILMAQGVLSMSGLSLLADGSGYRQRVAAHWVLQTAALVLITVAQTCIYVNKNINGYPHYSTVHSICGLVTYLLTLFATIGGVFNKYSSALKFIKPVQIKVGHGMLGSLVYVSGSATICVGLNQVWTEEKDAELKLATMVVIFLSCFYVVYRSLQRAIRRIAYM